MYAGHTWLSRQNGLSWAIKTIWRIPSKLPLHNGPDLRLLQPKAIFLQHPGRCPMPGSSDAYKHIPGRQRKPFPFDHRLSCPRPYRRPDISLGQVMHGGDCQYLVQQSLLLEGARLQHLEDQFRAVEIVVQVVLLGLMTVWLPERTMFRTYSSSVVPSRWGSRSTAASTSSSTPSARRSSMVMAESSTTSCRKPTFCSATILPIRPMPTQTTRREFPSCPSSRQGR